MTAVIFGLWTWGVIAMLTAKTVDNLQEEKRINKELSLTEDEYIRLLEYRDEVRNGLENECL